MIAEKDRPLIFTNVDGAHSPGSYSVLITAFLLIGHGQSSRNIVPKVSEKGDQAGVAALVNFMLKEFSPMEARISYKLRLGEYPELIKEVALALKKLSPEERSDPAHVSNAIAKVMLASNLVVTAHQEYLRANFVKNGKIKVHYKPIVTLQRYEKSFFALPIPSHNNVNVAKVRAAKERINTGKLDMVQATEQTISLRSKL